MSKQKTKSAMGVSLGIKIIFGVLVGWALLIAVGAVWGQTTGDVRKPLIILATMAIFLGVWAVALRSRQRQ